MAARAVLAGLLAWGISEPAQPEPWEPHSATRMGYAVSRSSSTGFAAIGGSALALDVGVGAGPELELGLRLHAVGGRRRELEYYRLGSGPYLSWRLAPQWRLGGALGFFRESGLSSAGGQIYRSRGVQTALDWQRYYFRSPRLDLALGGFIQAYHGDLDVATMPATARGAALVQQLERQAANRGWLQGLELMLCIRL